MNYVAQMNGFFDLKQRNPLSSNAQTLYINLFYIDNRCGWKPRFTVSNVTLQSLTGLSRQQLDRARNELTQKGYIEYKKGAGNQSGIYLLVSFDTQTDTQTDTQIDTQTDTQSGHKLRTLNKRKQKTKTETDIPPTCPPEEERKKKPAKKRYAEYVMLTEDEHQKLLQELGETGTDRVVEILNNYKGANGKKYKSDYLAIRNWVIERYRKQAPAGQGRYGSEDDFI